jgi:urease accessory protein
MDRDAKKMRGERPFVFTSIRQNEGLQAVVSFITREGMLEA